MRDFADDDIGHPMRNQCPVIERTGHRTRPRNQWERTDGAHKHAHLHADILGKIIMKRFRGAL